MKSVYRVLWFLLISAAVIYPLQNEYHWRVVTYPCNPDNAYSLYSIHAFDSIEAIAVGSGGTVLRIRKGPVLSKSILGNQSFNRVCFSDTVNGWIAGDGGSIYGTTDKGNTWQKQQAHVTVKLRSCAAPGRNCAWVVGDSGTILHTIDGGQNWKIQATPAANPRFTGPYDFISVSFRSCTEGCVAGYWRSTRAPVIFATCDGGETWVEVPLTSAAQSDFRNEPLEIVMDDLGVKIFFYRSGGDVPIVLPADKLGCCTGDTVIQWNEYSFQNTSDSSHLAFLNADLAGTCHKVIGFPHISNQKFYAIDSPDPLTAWIAGAHGTVYRTADGGKKWIPITAPGYVPVDNLTSICFAGPQKSWITGSHGTVLKSDDGGRTWRSAFEPINAMVHYLTAKFTDDQRGFLFGTLKPSPCTTWCFTTRDSGNTWEKEGSWEGFSDVSARTARILDNRKIILFAGGNTMRFSTDGGSTWQEKWFGNDFYYYDILPVTMDTFWIAGGENLNEGKLYRSTDGGTTNERILSIDHADSKGKAFRSITFSDPATGWVVGDSGLILKSSDSGYTWQRQPSPTRDTLAGIRFLNPRFGWMSGGGTIFLTTDGGANWIDKSIVSGIRINDFACSDTANCWAIGDSGLILHLANDADYQFFTIISPKKDEGFKTGATLAVRWLGGATAKVSIAVSYDNGATYTTYLASTDNDGEESLAISANATPSNSCILRIRSADGTVQAESEPFTIYEGNGIGADPRSPYLQQPPRIAGTLIRYYSSGETPVSISIFTPSGRMIYNRSIPQPGCGLRVERIPPNLLCNGCYLLRLTVENRQFIERLIVSR